MVEATRPSRNLALTTLAKSLGVHRNTVQSYLKEYGISRKFSDVPDGDLDTLVRSFRDKYPESGLRYLRGYVRSHGLRIQRRRVITSSHRVDGLGCLLRRQSRRIQRRQYHVSRPNALWHIDGHYKLIHWGIVIHGCADGYSRTVCTTTRDSRRQTNLCVDYWPTC